MISGLGFFDYIIIGAMLGGFIFAIQAFNIAIAVALLLLSLTVYLFDTVFVDNHTLHIIFISVSALIAFSSFVYVFIYKIPKNIGFWK